MTASAAVVDTNKVFSALIPKASAIRDMLLDTSMTFYAPSYLLSELSRHQAKLLKASRLSETELQT